MKTQSQDIFYDFFSIILTLGVEDWLPLQARRREAEEEIGTDEEEVRQF